MMWRILSLAGSTAVASVVLWHLTVGVLATNLVYDLLFFKPFDFGHWFLPVCCVAAVLWLARRKVRLTEYAFRPLWLMGGAFVWPAGKAGVFCFVLFIFTWAVMRFAALTRRRIRVPELPDRIAMPVAAGVAAAVAGWSFFLQYAAFDSWYLIFGDWGQYVECYLKLGSGGAPLKAWLSAAGHFNFLPNLLMTGALRLFPSPGTVFLINSLAIASAVPLVFILAVKNGLGNKNALLFAFLAAIYPVYTRQYLCIFYGFHPIIFFIPAVLGFFIFRTAGSKGGMTLCLAVSLLIQETVAIFWIGWALYLIAGEKKYRKGLLLFLAMGAWFAFLALCVQPWASGVTNYGQSFHYTALGNTPAEVLLSPLTRPGTFIRELFAPRNFLFAAILLAPVWTAALSFPGMLVAGLPLLAGICLQSSDDVKTPLLQYGVELSTLLLALSVVNLGRLRRGEVGRLCVRGKRFRGIWTATAAGILLGYIFFGFGFKFGLYPGDIYLHGPDASKATAFLRKHLPEHPSRLLITGRIRMHFIFDYPTFPLTPEYRIGDWLLLDLHDPVFEDMGKIEALRHKLYRDPRCYPVTYVSWHGKHLVLIRIAPPGQPRRVTPVKIPAELFAGAGGQPISTGRKGIKARYDGRQLHFRVEEPQPCDYDVFFDMLFPDGKSKKLEYSWYFGLFPAWSAEPGTLWNVSLPRGISALRVTFKERPGSALSSTRGGDSGTSSPASAK